MITTEDMAVIISERLGAFGMPTYIKGHIPFETIPKEGRITITPKEDSEGRIFDKCFVEVNFILPDINQEAHYELDAIERNAYELFKDGFAGSLNGQHYNVSYSRRSREQNEQLKSHYVHIQLLFETLNTL